MGLSNARTELLFVLFLSCAASGCSDDNAKNNHPNGIGNYCEADEDCETGECYLGPGGDTVQLNAKTKARPKMNALSIPYANRCREAQDGAC